MDSLEDAKKCLYWKFRSLALPLLKLEETDLSGGSAGPPIEDSALQSLRCGGGTDGRRLFRPDPAENSNFSPELFLLHEVLHCLLGHPFRRPADVSGEEWNRACDDTVEQFIRELSPELLPGGLRLPADFHGLWPVFRPGSRAAGTAKVGGDEGRGGTAADSELKSLEQEWDRLSRQLSAPGQLLSPKFRQMTPARRKQTERKGSRRGIGQGTAGRRHALTLTDTRRGNYRSLLKDLADWGEDFRLSTSEFHYPSYLYGLEHYDGLPLLEPLESEEAKKIRELVIVIDTSASCSHSLTRAFLEETRNLIEEEDLFFHPFNLHILQCDTKVRRDDKITSLDDWDYYIESLEIQGMGGTDFRPAFSYIKELEQSREFSHLSGILYFTDGSGLYPEAKPDTKTIFLFLDRQYDDIDTPDWAETLVLPADRPKGSDHEY